MTSRGANFTPYIHHPPVPMKAHECARRYVTTKTNQNVQHVYATSKQLITEVPRRSKVRGKSLPGSSVHCLHSPTHNPSFNGTRELSGGKSSSFFRWNAWSSFFRWYDCSSILKIQTKRELFSFRRKAVVQDYFKLTNQTTSPHRLQNTPLDGPILAWVPPPITEGLRI